MNFDEKDVYEIMDRITQEDMDNGMEGIAFDSDAVLTKSGLKHIKKQVYKKLGSTRFSAKKRIALKIAAAALAVSICMIGLISPGKVWAAILSALEYIPGFGIVLDSENDFERYILKSSVKTVLSGTGDTFVTLKEVVAGKNHLMVYLQGNSNKGPVNTVTLIDAEGNRYPGTGGGGGGSIEINYEARPEYEWWVANFEFDTTSCDLEGMKIIIEDYDKLEIPFSLIKPQTYESFEEIGPSDDKNGVSIAAIASRQGDKIKINYITKPDERSGAATSPYWQKKLVWTYKESLAGKHGVLKNSYDFFADEYGLADQNGLYFESYNTEDKEFELTIPSIGILESRNYSAFSIPVPNAGEIVLNKAINLDGYPMEVKSVKRISPDYLALSIDTHTDFAKTDALLGCNFKIVNDKISRSYLSASYATIQDINGELSKYKIKPYFDLYEIGQTQPGFPEHLKTAYVPIESNVKTLELEIIGRMIYKKGPWKFKFTLD